MESKILAYLENIDKRIQQIEVDLKHKSDGFHDESSRQRHEVKNSNFYNQMKEELDSRDYNQASNSRSKVKKASSFTEKSRQKPTRIRRSPHTVPSDKEEERRLRSFHRECLSKAIQWNFVDMLNAVSRDLELVLPSWVKSGESRKILQGTDKKMHLRRFLNLLTEKDFNVMLDWIKDCGIEKDVIKKVWGTFEEFSDHDLNHQTMKCLHCRLVENVNITHVADHFYSADVIEKDQYMKIMETQRPVGAQKELWDVLLKESSKVRNTKIVTSALTIALCDNLSNAGNVECCNAYQSVCDQVRESDDVENILICHCGEICAQSLHPLTCLKSMSLARVYFSPPTARKHKSFSSSSDCGPESSPSSHSSMDDNLNDPQEACKDICERGEFALEEDCYKRGMVEAFEKQHRNRAQSRIRKDKRHTNNTKTVSTGIVPYSNGNFVVRDKHEKTDNLTFEKHTTIINAKNVHLGSGLQCVRQNTVSYSRSESRSSSSEFSNGPS